VTSDQVEFRHLTSGEAAAMLDERVEGAERSRLVAHLANCADCRHELAQLRGDLEESGLLRRSRRWPIVAAACAAAVVVAAIVPVTRLARNSNGSQVEVMRSAGAIAPTDAATSIDALSPADSAIVTRSSVLLAWRPSGAAASYAVTVQDTAGAVMWSKPLADTVVSVPSDVPLVSGHRYFWSVEARRADGVSSRTELRSFTVR